MFYGKDLADIARNGEMRGLRRFAQKFDKKYKIPERWVIAWYYAMQECGWEMVLINLSGEPVFWPGSQNVICLGDILNDPSGDSFILLHQVAYLWDNDRFKSRLSRYVRKSWNDKQIETFAKKFIWPAVARLGFPYVPKEMR